MWKWWRRLIVRPETVARDVLIAPDVRRPSRRRQRTLRKEYKRNEAARKPPYARVRLETLGEVLWVLLEREWRGGMTMTVPPQTPDWFARPVEPPEPADLRGA
ncbi:MAG: hypothetical protein ACRDHE_01640, partial [Ktedonobacterales bacterium]